MYGEDTWSLLAPGLFLRLSYICKNLDHSFACIFLAIFYSLSLLQFCTFASQKEKYSSIPKQVDFEPLQEREDFSCINLIKLYEDGDGKLNGGPQVIIAFMQTMFELF